LSLISLFNTVN